jgi:ATP-dependent Clp protease ATP-binding subunit ClpB
MQFDKFTLKSQEAIQSAQQFAESNNNQEITPSHLIKAILEQPDGVVVPALQKMGVAPSRVLSMVNDQIQSLPKVSGSGAVQVYVSGELKRLLDNSFSAASQMQDDYVSQEHIFLALLRERGSNLADKLGSMGISEQNFLKALSSIRGNQRVTDPYPEEKYQALEKYGKNLTDIAKQGKLDPVIGRDEEIRRIIQVLSRRTKKQPGTYWRARRRQDGHCRRAGPADRQRRHPGYPKRQAGCYARFGLIGGRSQISRRI